jgi:lipoprotein-anchoring transpeptidase ErfK/SrfK
MMIKRILTVWAAVATGAAGISLAQAQQAYPVPPGNGYSSGQSSYPPGYQGPAYLGPGYQRDGYPSDYRRGGMPAGQDFDALEDDDAPNTAAALPPPGPVMSPDDPRYGRPAGAPVYSGAPSVYTDRSAPLGGPVMSPDDPRYGRPAGAPPVYSDRAVPTGPVMSPDDPRYGRPAGPPVIYADRPGGQPQPYADVDPNAPRPPQSVGGAVTGATQPPTGADGRPITLAALPPEEQPDAAPAQLAPNLRRQEVAFATKEPAGTIVVDTSNTYLYYVLGGGRAIRYGVRVGREGFTWTGVQKITKKTEWPDWFPPTEMIERQPYLPRFMAGGTGNPLGARAMYLGATVYRIHGTNQPSTIGKFVSSGCIGMLNEDVSDLFDRAKVGTRVVVLPGGPRPGTATASAQPMPGPVAGPGAPAPTQMSNAPAPGMQPTTVPPLPAPVTIR